MSVKWQTLNLEKCLEQVKYPNKILRKEFLEKGKFPIISQEQDFINGYWDKETDIFYAKNYPVVIFGDHTKILKYVDFDFVLGADGVKILKPKDLIDPKYFYYFLNACPIKSLGYARHYRILKELDVRFPACLSEQKKIVAILDEAFEGIDRAITNTEKNLVNARELFKSHVNEVFTHKDKGWSKKKLGEVCRFENGDRGKNYPNREEYVELGIPWINTGHIQPDGTLSQSEMNFITQEKYESLRSGKIQPGDLVYCLRGATIGKTALVDPLTVGAVASSLVIIRPEEHLNGHFLYYFLTSVVGQRLIKLYDNGAAQPNLGAKSVAKYIIPLPKIAEQKFVVQNITSLAAETQYLEVIYKQKLAALKELKQSILQKAFTGELTADTAKQTIEAAEEHRPISKDCLHSTEPVKQNVHQSGQLSLWA